MDAKAKQELQDIISELGSIISELEGISYNVRTGFKGIGSEKCADCIDNVVAKYRKARTKLRNIDSKKIGGGGGRSF